MSKLLKFTLIFLFLLFFYKAQVFAAGECINPNPPPNFYDSAHACNNWTEYDCPWGTDYGYNVGKRTVTQYCDGISADCTGTISYGNWFSFDDCDDCEYCVSGQITCSSVSPPLSPPDGATSVKTPVTLDWCDTASAQSYQLKIYEVDTDGNEQDFSTKITTKSEACIKNFSENAEYKWQVADCSNNDGTDCKPLGQKWSFTTDGAASIGTPVISSPADGANVSIPVPLDWFGVAGAKSYYINIYDSTDQLVGIDITTASQLTVDLCPLSKNTTFKWEVAACLNDDGTRCGAGCCDNESGYGCGSFDSGTFNTTGEATLAIPVLIEPLYVPSAPEPIVNLSDSLEWERVCGANSYRYEIKEAGITNSTSSTAVGFDELWFDELGERLLDFGTVYSWHVKSCSDDQGNECENTWSEEWKFKTAGGTPAGLTPADGATGVIIPVELSWDSVEGAASYQYQVSSDVNFVGVDTVTAPYSRVSVDYPDITVSTLYYWRVRACIDSSNTACGDWSETRKFTTISMGIPQNPFSPADGTVYTYQKYISWAPVPGANFYQYTLDYPSQDPPPDEPSWNECKASAGATPLAENEIISSPSVYLDLDCLGQYRLFVRACLDMDVVDSQKICQEPGDWTSPPWLFTLVQPEPPAQFGLLPCNRETDNLKTPWDEKDSCELRHIILIFKGMLELILWRIGMIFLVILIVATAVIFYFSLGAPASIVNVKSIWKRAGQGYAIMFLAWLVINMLVKIVGFTDKWWELPF